MNILSGQDNDDIIELANLICETSIAQVSLINSGQQRIKSKHGIDADFVSPLVRFCEQTMARPNELFVVPDARHDERFADSPMAIDGTQICFYAGVALVTDEGDTLGTLCVIDQLPSATTLRPSDSPILSGPRKRHISP